MTKNVKKVTVSAILVLAALVLGACSGAAPVSGPQGQIGPPSDSGGRYYFEDVDFRGSFDENNVDEGRHKNLAPKPRISIDNKTELKERIPHSEKFELSYKPEIKKDLFINENCSPTEVVFKTKEKPVQKISLHWEYNSKQKAVDFYLTKGGPIEVIYKLDKEVQERMEALKSKDCKQEDSIEMDVLNRYIIREVIKDNHLTPNDFLVRVNKYWLF